MVRLGKLVEKELGNVSTVKVDPTELIERAEETEYITLSGSLYGNNTGMCDYLPEDKKQKIRNIVDDFVKTHEGWNTDPGHKAIYEQIKNMKPGDLRRLRAYGEEFLLAAFRAPMPALSLVLFC